MTITSTPIIGGRWLVREYTGGEFTTFDAAEVSGSAVSQGFGTYSAAVQWAAEQEAARRILNQCRKNDDASALRRAFA